MSLLCLVLFYSNNVYSQEKKELIFHNSEKLKIQGHAQFGVNAVAETNLFWDLADVPELDFNSDTQWLESYIKSGISLINKTGTHSSLYLKVSAVGSYTMGTDAFDAKNTGKITLENAHIGYKFKISDSTFVDASIGSRELKLGTGMLISNGASSGFERGALKFGPRKAWEKSAIVEVTSKKNKSKVFYISPNELPSNDTKNELAGIDLNYYQTKDKYIGLSYINVLESLAPYPKAAPNGEGAPIITPGDRDGLNALNLYTKTRPFKKTLKHLFTALDVAYQWNDRIDMSSFGGRLQVGYDLVNIPWRPTLMYSYQTFSGDKPNTSGQERFDPLYFEGNPSAWSTGSKSSMVFINSNVQSNGVSIRVSPSKKDIITLRYAHISAQQLRSPIQFGQAARVEFFR
ncbi:hypothetical protein [Snuella lapsa]